MNSSFLFLFFTSLFVIQFYLIDSDPGDDARVISQPLRPLKVNSVPLDYIENGRNILRDKGLDEIEEENSCLQSTTWLNRDYALVNKIIVDGTKIMPPSEMPMIISNIGSPAWTFLIETKKENKEFLFPCKLAMNTYKLSNHQISGESQKGIFRSYRLFPIKQYDHNKYIQVNFVTDAISDMQDLVGAKVYMYVLCKKPKLTLNHQNIPVIALEYKEVKSSIPAISEEEYEKWKNIPEDKLLDTPPKSYDFSEFVAISNSQYGKIFVGKRYKKCKSFELSSYYTVGIVYYEAYNYYDRSLSKDEIKRQMLFSCSPEKILYYYHEQKFIREWEIVPDHKILSTPPKSYEYSKRFNISKISGQSTRKIYIGMLYKKCETLKEASDYLVGLIYKKDSFTVKERSLSKDEIERQMLYSCGSKELIYHYLLTKSIEEWEVISENKLLSTPPESYEYSKLFDISKAQSLSGKILIGMLYNKCKILGRKSHYLVGVIYHENLEKIERSLSKEEVEWQMLHSCGSTKIVYHYPQTKTLKKWEVIPPGCKVNAPSLGYFSTETIKIDDDDGIPNQLITKYLTTCKGEDVIFSLCIVGGVYRNQTHVDSCFYESPTPLLPSFTSSD